MAAYRLAPANHAQAGIRGGCDRLTARRAWFRGWVDAKPPVPWARPIKEVLAEETRAARAAMADAKDRYSAEIEEFRAKARAQLEQATARSALLLEAAGKKADGILSQAQAQAEERVAQAQAEALQALTELRARAEWNAVEARAREGMVVQGARETVLALLALGSEVLKHGQQLAHRVLQALDNPTIKPREAMGLMVQLSRFVQNTNEAAHLAMQMERLHLGQPGAIVELREMTPEEASLRIQKAERARLRWEGKLKVLTGGAGGAA